MFALKMNNIILENFEMYTKKTLSCHLYSSFWKHNPFGDVCDLKFYNFYFFLYCLHFSAAADAGCEKYLWLKCISLEMASDNMVASESKGGRVSGLGLKSLS